MQGLAGWIIVTLKLRKVLALVVGLGEIVSWQVLVRFQGIARRRVYWLCLWKDLELTE